jgi:hypothetical protein
MHIESTRLRQWLWFVALWAAGVVALGLAATLLRSLMQWAAG